MREVRVSIKNFLFIKLSTNRLRAYPTHATPECPIAHPGEVPL